jgi:ABC-type multidrug transport system fused ATPase/permease subunit
LNIPSSIAGVGTILVLILTSLFLGKRFAKYRGETADATDVRVKQINEVIEGISTVKSFVWEVPFFKLIKKSRKIEKKSISNIQFLQSLDRTIFFVLTSTGSFSMFFIFWFLNGKLTNQLVFSSISLLQTLRYSASMWIHSVESGAEAFASCYRVESFLDLNSDDRVENIINTNVEKKGFLFLILLFLKLFEEIYFFCC